jgi:hypothetical protein
MHPRCNLLHTPITDLNKSHEERRSWICASTFENLKHNILSVDEASSPELKTSDYTELIEAVDCSRTKNLLYVESEWTDITHDSRSR